MKMKSFGTTFLKHLMFSLPIALTISGCASITYVEPQSGPVAKVRFASNTSMPTIIRSYSSTACTGENEMMRLRNGFFLNSEPKKLGIPLWNYHENAAKEFFVSTNNEQIYMFESTEIIGGRNRKCGVAVKQKFEAGKDYELSYSMNNSNCYVVISEIKNNASGQPEKVILQKRDSHLSADFSEACISEFKKIRLW